MKRSILYLDDEASCLNIFQGTFGGDYDVRTAETLQEARLLLSQRPSDVVISDQVMPEMKGAEFLREVAENYPASSRVLLTGGVTVGHVLGDVSTGVVQFFVRKPWTEEEVLGMLERTGASLSMRGKRT